MQYSKGFKESLIRKVVDGSGRSIAQVAQEANISPSTLRDWVRKYSCNTMSINGTDSVVPSKRNPGEKFTLLLEGKSLPKEQLGDWLRKHGLHSEHLTLWEQELSTFMTDKQKELGEINKSLQKENKRLQAELARKDKALAEAAVLLTLKKKYRHLFAIEGDMAEVK
jgi:transposase